MNAQPLLLDNATSAGRTVAPFKTQLLKWIGNKQRQAPEIIAAFPERFGTYFEPFLGSGGVMATLAPERGVGSDIYGPLIAIFKQLRLDRRTLKAWYAERHAMIEAMGKVEAYNKVLADFNRSPNPADFVFLTRACYGGVVRFRKADGYMSTPCGAHQPIDPSSFSQRVDIWAQRLAGCTFEHQDYREAFTRARAGDLIYCDPPYVHTQTILYGAQAFSVSELFAEVERAKSRGVYVAVSLDGRKKSAESDLHIDIPQGLFERAALVDVGTSMLDRFQRGGGIMSADQVHDRLLLTY